MTWKYKQPLITSPVVPKTYTKTPSLHPETICGSIQLIFWLLFRRLAWQNHIAHMDFTLSPDFSLPQLSREQWRNPDLRRLLIQGYLILPLLLSILLYLLGTSAEGIAHALSLSVAVGISGGVAFSVAIGIAAGVAGGLASGMSVTAMGTVIIEKAVNPVEGGSPIKAAEGIGLAFRNVAEGIGLVFGEVGSAIEVAGVLGLAFGAAYGVTVGVAFCRASQKPAYSWVRHCCGALIGTLVGGMAIRQIVIFSGGIADTNSDVLAYTILALVAFVFVIGERTHQWIPSILYGVEFSVLHAVAYWVAGRLEDSSDEQGFAKVVFNIAVGLVISVAGIAFFALPYALADSIAGSWAGAVAGGLGSGTGWITFLELSTGAPMGVILTAVLIGTLSGLTLVRWRSLLLYPLLAIWNTLLYQLDKQCAGSKPTFLRWHCAFWDEWQRLPLCGLDKHLLLVMERNPDEGKAAMSYLSTTCQRWAAQATQIELDARKLERCGDVEALRQAHRSLAVGELEGPASNLLRSFSRISEDVNAALNQGSTYNQRLALNAVAYRLDGLWRESIRSSDKYTVRFRPIATRWGQIVDNYVRELAEAVEVRQEIDSPYIIAVPLTKQQEIFVGRTDIATRIEQLLLDRRRPPLLVYGQRRMGKTSLLNNLGRLLPNSIISMFVDLQGPASSANDYAGFLYNIARSMEKSAQRQSGLTLPTLTREALVVDPFTCFDEWLDNIEQILESNTALLILDEFEALDRAITKGRFDEEYVLGMLRNLIQHRPRFKVLIAGSHTLQEFQRWASYLINVQVVHVGYLNEPEARQLIERPVKDFTLRYKPDASDRIIALTRCHPCLVQLLCAEIIALKNEQDPSVRRLATIADVEAAVPQVLSTGSFFFADIDRNQVTDTGRAVLRAIAACGEDTTLSIETLWQQFRDRLHSTLDELLRRELIELQGDGYRFQVELIRRWFQ